MTLHSETTNKSDLYFDRNILGVGRGFILLSSTHYRLTDGQVKSDYKKSSAQKYQFNKSY